jgi:hypothetical protein
MTAVMSGTQSGSETEFNLAKFRSTVLYRVLMSIFRVYQDFHSHDMNMAQFFAPSTTEQRIYLKLFYVFMTIFKAII